MKLLLYLFCFLVTPFWCLAQFSISGRVLSQTDARPVTNASVFLNNETIGAKTADDGTFNLKNIKPGKCQLVVSIIGFETYRKIITLKDDIVLPNITIAPKAIVLNEVKIKPKDETYHDRNYAWFKNYFLGTSDDAKSCEIENPRVLDLDYDDDENLLTASSPDFLIIKNDVLGYKVLYLLKDFEVNTKTYEFQYDGSAFFEEMEGPASREKQWKKNREEAYENSSMHFLRAALKDQIDENGFLVQLLANLPNPERPSDEVVNAKISQFKSSNQRDSLNYWNKKLGLPKTVQKFITTPLSSQDIIKTTGQKGIYALKSNKGLLYITYNKNHRFNLKENVNRLDDPNNKEATLLKFSAAEALFDSNGILLDPAAISFSGAWGNSRAATILPSDYEPPQSPISQTDSAAIKKITTKLSAFTLNHPVEKIYLHLDKPVYFLGDTIWYKAYSVIAEQHRLSALSGVLYVELTGRGDTVIARQNLHLSSGLSWGAIGLSTKLPPGDYHIRAYTNWMRNSGPDYFYDRKLQIIGPPPVVAITAKQTNPLNPDVQFFPEGGELVTGLRSKVAVKAINQNGLGEGIKGTIVDNDGNEIADFASQHLGMGVFALLPQSGKTYKAQITTNSGAAFTVDLPRAQEAGFTLSVDNREKDSIYIKVAANEQFFKARQNSGFYLVAQQNGKIYYTAAGKLAAPVFSSAIEKSRFPSGLVQFTLFSESGEPLNERVSFIQNDDTLKLNLTTKEGNYTTRQKVNIQLDAKDRDKKPVTGNFSVSVINESRLAMDEDAESTILNNLLLTSDLKGFIEKPNYYFINPTDQTRADLDVLMLTQGYRRFEWKQILNDQNTLVAYQPQTMLELSGSLKTPSGKPIANGKINLAATREGLFVDTVSDSNGNFKFKGLDLPDTAKMLLNARTAKNEKNVTIIVKNSDYAPALASIKTENVILLPDEQALMAKNYSTYGQIVKNDSLKNARLLKEVKIQAKRIDKGPDLSSSANLNGPGNADQVIMGGELNCGVLSDCLIGKIHNATLENGKFYTFRSQNDINYPGGKAVKPAMILIVDGAIMDGSEIDGINTEDVYSIEVLESNTYLAIYGSNAPGGALVITLKRGGESTHDDKSTSGLIILPFNGFYKVKEFYSPKYADPKKETEVDDLRNTIYWNPDVITDKDGKASFEYFNDDTRGTYRVVIEGIDESGNLGRAVYRYKVE